MDFRPLNDISKYSKTRHTSTYELMRRLMRESVRPYMARIGLAIFFMAVMAAATSMTAWLMKPIVNRVFVAKEEEMLWLIGGAVLATFTIKGLANYAQTTMMSHVGLKIIADNQNRLFAHLARMDISFFNSAPTGKLVSRFTVDINQMQVAVSNALTGFGKDTLSLVGLIGVMLYQDWMLTIVSFFIFPIAITFIVRLGKKMRRVTADTQEEMGQLTTLLEQTFQGIRVVKAYVMEEYEKKRVAEVVRQIFKLNMKAVRTRALASPIMETLGGTAVAVVIVYGGHQVVVGRMDAGSFFSFITALLLAYEPMKRLANLNSSLQGGLAGAQRLFEMLDTEPEVVENHDARDINVPKGNIRLESAHFSYIHGRPAIRGINLEVPAGKTAALVGPSGAGKSTILNLIPRFYDLDSGCVTIDGADIRDATFASLHANIALVSQEITLFDDTIRANIAYGLAGADDEQIIEAAKNAAAHDFILELADGYDTIVGERGVKISGGQRQRLAIARAMIKNAPILLLDEATSSLDSQSEHQVQTALERLMEGRTTLVIAHRLSTVIDADIIYVIENGQVAESGSHADLLAIGGAYSVLYAMQFANRK